MSGLRLDYQQNKPFPWGGAILLVLALAMVAMTWTYYRDLINQAAVWEAKAERAQQSSRKTLPDSRYGAHMAKNLALEMKHANDVLGQLSLPWESLFLAVESSGGKEVALLSLEPDTQDRSVKISGEAKNMTALLNYIKQLEQCNVLGPVYLQSHQVQQQDPDKPVRFSLLASWQRKS